jgi:hypothetical protein
MADRFLKSRSARTLPSSRLESSRIPHGAGERLLAYEYVALPGDVEVTVGVKSLSQFNILVRALSVSPHLNGL